MKQTILVGMIIMVVACMAHGCLTADESSSKTVETYKWTDSDMVSQMDVEYPVTAIFSIKADGYKHSNMRVVLNEDKSADVTIDFGMPEPGQKWKVIYCTDVGTTYAIGNDAGHNEMNIYTDGNAMLFMPIGQFIGSWQ